MKTAIKRYFSITVLVLLIGMVYFVGLNPHEVWDRFQSHHLVLKEYVHNHFFLSFLAYVAFYTLFTALAMPGPMFVTMIGGLLFPQPFSTIGATVGATTGATCLFMIARTALTGFLERNASYFLRMKKSFEKNRYGYLFFLRLVPAVPFWLANLALAFFGISPFTFVWTTLIGLIPITFVFAQAGAGMSSLIDSGQEITLSNIFNHDVNIALLSLAVFACVPFLLKKYIASPSRE